MTDAINRTSQLVSILRTQLARPSRQVSSKRAQDRRQEVDDEQVSTLIALRVSQIRADDSARGRKAFRIFVEAVLLSHFGDAVAQDPKFHQVVDDVQREMESNATVALMVEMAIGHLLNQQPNEG
jgi:hypothetical protein